MSDRNRRVGARREDEEESMLGKIFKSVLVGAAVAGVGALIGYTVNDSTLFYNLHSYST